VIPLGSSTKAKANQFLLQMNKPPSGGWGQKQGIAFGDPLGKILQSLQKPCGFYLFLFQFLQKTSFPRNFIKINNPT
jgi:hypothetical protein